MNVGALIEKLRQYPPNLLVALSSPVRSDELFEGVLDGPSKFEVVSVQDVRSGFNPVGVDGATEHDVDWDVLFIGPRGTRPSSVWAWNK
jgi:hypothetical protein